MSGGALLADYVELNMSNYDQDDVSRLNEWAIRAYAALATAPEQAGDAVTHHIGGRAVCHVETPVGHTVQCVSEGLGITRVVVTAPPPASTPNPLSLCGKSCQTGYKDICHAAKYDGVVCADDECDIDSGIRSAPPPASTNRLTGEQIHEIADALRRDMDRPIVDFTIAFARAIIAATEAK